MSRVERCVELDGVRGVAILLVLAGHADPRLAPLAAAGVTLFFVLSGYLITGLLMAEWAQQGRLELRRFYVRRLSRLAPPLFFMLGVMAPLLHANWEHWLAAATWIGNYTGGVGVDPFGHTWSLAVEEQFYLVWPICFIALVRFRGHAPYVLVSVILVLFTWRILLTMRGHLDYAYFAFETAGLPLLCGCLLALAGWRLPKRRAALALAATCGLPLIGSGPEAAWVLTPILVLPAVVALVAAAEGSMWLARRPLAFCGVASYSLYLWHKPVAWCLGGAYSSFNVMVGAVVGLAAYCLLEAPLMRWRATRKGAGTSRSESGATVATDSVPSRI
jgi:peptidoglycan/LPS O-acetylase OafA/YrhL